MRGADSRRSGSIGRSFALVVAAVFVIALFLSAASSVSAAPATRFVLTVPATATAGSAVSVTVTAVKANNSVDSSYKGPKTLAWSGPGVAPSGTQPVYPTNPVAFAGGVATVSITLYRAESVTLQVADGSIGGGAVVTVVPGAPASLRFVQQPTETQVSSVINAATDPSGVRVEAKDAFGNLASNTSVGIAIGSNPPENGLLSGTTTRATDAFGVAIFGDLSIDKVGVGYPLLARAPAIDATVTKPSSPFIVAQTVKRCGSTCSASASIGQDTTLAVSASGTLSGNTLGIALLGAAVPPAGACPGFIPATGAPGSYVNVNSMGRGEAQPTLTIVWTLDKQIVDLQPQNGVAGYNLCLGAVNLLHPADPTFNSGWTTKQGTPAARVLDPAFGVYVFWGVLPDCPNKGPLTGPCAISRKKSQAGDLIFTYAVPYPWDPNGWLG